MIVKNEAGNLGPCLRSIQPVLDEIIIVDTGSTDDTKDVARQMGAKVFDFTWRDDFSAARNESIRHATGDYILWLDADDRLDEAEVRKIELLKKRLPSEKNRAYYLMVSSSVRKEGEIRFNQLRIFPRMEGALFEGRVHEQIFYALSKKGMKFTHTDIVVRHTGYHDPTAQREKTERNLRVIEKELESDPDNLLLRYHAGRTLAGLGRQTEAIVHMKKITEDRRVRVQEGQFHLEASLLLGKYYVESKSYEEAISVFKDLSRKDEKNGLILFCLGESLFLRQDYSSSIDALRKSLLFPLEVGFFPVNLDRLRYSQYSLLGQCYLETGTLDLAEEYLLKSLQFPGDHLRSLEALGLLCLKTRQFGKSVEYYERAIREGGASDQNCSNLGLAHSKLGDLEKARESLYRALTINPLRTEALTNLGHLHHKMKEYGQATDCFKAALRIDPHLTDVRLALAEISYRIGDLDHLVTECETLLTELSLPCNLTVNSYEELSGLFEMIGEALLKKKRKELSLMADHVSFLIAPSQRRLEKILSGASSGKGWEHSAARIEEAIQYHRERTSTVKELGKPAG
jgi:glycosyltransferase involved in cell wall biosynthesis